MVLDTNSLFPSLPLEQGTGVISERWGQEGNEIINIIGDNVQDELIYTVTSGKRLFIKSIMMDYAAAGTDSGQLRDGNGGTVKIDFHVFDDQNPQMYVFDTPLYFDSGIWIVGTLDVDISLTGWEEPI